jgi:hypothetical protein
MDKKRGILLARDNVREDPAESVGIETAIQ